MGKSHLCDPNPKHTHRLLWQNGMTKVEALSLTLTVSDHRITVRIRCQYVRQPYINCIPLLCSDVTGATVSPVLHQQRCCQFCVRPVCSAMQI